MCKSVSFKSFSLLRDFATNRDSLIVRDKTLPSSVKLSGGADLTQEVIKSAISGVLGAKYFDSKPFIFTADVTNRKTFDHAFSIKVSVSPSLFC